MSPPRPHDIQAVSFDVGETLIHINPSVGVIYSRVCREEGVLVDPAAAQAAYDRVWAGIAREVPRGENRYTHVFAGEREFWRTIIFRTLEQVGAAEQARGREGGIFDRLYAAFLQPESWTIFDDVHGALTTLRERGVRLGGLSNWDSRLPRLLEVLALAPYFDFVLASGIEGKEKPAPEFCRKAVERFDLPPERIAHIGDKVSMDCRGAEAVDMVPVLLDRADRRAEEPYPRVTGLHGLLDFV